MEDRGAWQATVHEVAVRHNLATEQQQIVNTHITSLDAHRNLLKQALSSPWVTDEETEVHEVMGSVCIRVRAPMCLPSGLPTGTPGQWHLYAKVNREALLEEGKTWARPEGWGEAGKGTFWADRTTAKVQNRKNQHFPRRAKMSCWLEPDVWISSRNEIPTHEWSFKPHINHSIAQMLSVPLDAAESPK